MRPPVVHRHVAAPAGLVALLGGVLLLAGCSAPAVPATSATPAAAPTTEPSASAAPVVRFALPKKVNGLPRSTKNGWLKEIKSVETSLKRSVFDPRGGSVAAVYEDPDDLSESIQLSAAAGQVLDPAETLQLLTANRSIGLEAVRPADPGTAGGFGKCGVSYEFARPAVVTICDWAEPGSVGWVRILSSKDRRDRFADLRAQLQP